MDKRRRGPTFADIAAAARETTGHPLDGRHRKRVLGDDAWDPVGLYWERQPAWLPRGDVERLLRTAALVVVHDTSGARWYDAREGRQLWRETLSPWLIENNRVDHLDKVGFPDHVVYSAEVRRRGDGRHIVWFETHC